MTGIELVIVSQVDRFDAVRLDFIGYRDSQGRRLPFFITPAFQDLLHRLRVGRLLFERFVERAVQFVSAIVIQ